MPKMYQCLRVRTTSTLQQIYLQSKFKFNHIEIAAPKTFSWPSIYFVFDRLDVRFSKKVLIIQHVQELQNINLINLARTLTTEN
jgi:hypothetical protein